MAAPTIDQWDRNIDTSWFERAVEADAFTTFFQPIVDTKERKVFAHECLIRLFTDRPYSGGEIMEAAMGRGRVHLFDSYARRLSIRKAAAQHQAGTKVFVNALVDL
jgi:EAL domain-containing protein (putative c-di-GMP-specific phosphodiesterase class I)